MIDPEDYDEREERQSRSTAGCCGTCRHNGCCDGLPYCGGGSWRSAYVTCVECGKEMHFEDENIEEINGKVYCANCAEEIKEANNGQ